MPVNLLELLVCPITRQPLSFDERGGHSALVTADGSARYMIEDGAYLLMPRTPPVSLAHVWTTWEHLQRNGALSYTLCPQLNLMLDDADAGPFADFMALKGSTLDIGCGPTRARPTYARGIEAADYVGLDPIKGALPREFTFIHGLAECLPFRDGGFDNVIFSSSLDHTMDFRIALKEAVRVLRPGGKLHLRFDDIADTMAEPGGLARFADIARRGLRQFFLALGHLGPVGAVRYVWTIATLKIPAGAVDYFHMRFPLPDEIFGVLESMGLQTAKRITFRTEWFVMAVKPA